MGKKYYGFRTTQKLTPEELQKEDHHKLKVKTVHHVVKYETMEEKLGEFRKQSTSQPKNDMETFHLQKQSRNDLEQSTEALFPPKLNCGNLSLDAHWKLAEIYH